jgi:hypothetical protein
MDLWRSCFSLFCLTKSKKKECCRYGIMEKLRRLQAGEDVEDLLAEIGEITPRIL